LDEVDEVLEASVQVSFSTKLDDAREVREVYMSIDTEKTLEDLLDASAEVLGELGSKLKREDLLVVELGLDPTHEEVDVLGRRHLDRLLVLNTIHPEIFIVLTSVHDRT
jgi:hypothetical protein